MTDWYDRNNGLNRRPEDFDAADAMSMEESMLCSAFSSRRNMGLPFYGLGRGPIKRADLRINRKQTPEIG